MIDRKDINKFKGLLVKGLNFGIAGYPGRALGSYILYNSARNKIIRMNKGPNLDKQGFLDIMNKREFFDKMGNKEYEYLMDIMPHLIKVYNKEFELAERKVDYFDMLLKFKLTSIKFNYDQIISDEPCIKTAGVRYRYVKVNNKLFICFGDLKMDLNQFGLEIGEQYYDYIHEIRHLLAMPIKAKKFKLGLSYLKNKKQKLLFLEEGNANRFANLVLNEMKKNGKILECVNYSTNPSYDYAESKVAQILAECPQGYQAMHGEVKELKKFIKDYNSLHEVTLEEIDERAQKLIDKEHFDKLFICIDKIAEKTDGEPLKETITVLKTITKIIVEDSTDPKLLDLVFDAEKKYGVRVDQTWLVRKFHYIRARTTKSVLKSKYISYKDILKRI